MKAPPPAPRYAIAELIGGRHGALDFARGDLDAVGVDGDVLGRRREGDDQREQGHLGQVLRRIGRRHAEDAQADADHGHEHPAPPLAHGAGQKRQRQAVHYRGPEELDRIGDADPTEETNGAAADVLARQPAGKSGEHHEKRQSGGKAQEEHPGHLGVFVNEERFAPAFPCRAGARGCPHARPSFSPTRAANGTSGRAP